VVLRARARPAGLAAGEPGVPTREDFAEPRREELRRLPLGRDEMTCGGGVQDDVRGSTGSEDALRTSARALSRLLDIVVREVAFESWRWLLEDKGGGV
jgi:hypothetical protein